MTTEAPSLHVGKDLIRPGDHMSQQRQEQISAANLKVLRDAPVGTTVWSDLGWEATKREPGQQGRWIVEGYAGLLDVSVVAGRAEGAA